jgi:hypothetical protein
MVSICTFKYRKDISKRTILDMPRFFSYKQNWAKRFIRQMFVLYWILLRILKKISNSSLFININDCKLTSLVWIRTGSLLQMKLWHAKWSILMPIGSLFLAIPLAQWSKWPKFVSLHYWHAPRGARGIKISGQPNWSPLWWVGALRFSQNWRNSKKPSKLNKNCQRNPVSWRFFQFHSIWAES